MSWRVGLIHSLSRTIQNELSTVCSCPFEIPHTILTHNLLGIARVHGHRGTGRLIGRKSDLRLYGSGMIENLAHGSHTEGRALTTKAVAKNSLKVCVVCSRDASPSAPQKVHLVGPVHFSNHASERNQRPDEAPNVCRRNCLFIDEDHTTMGSSFLCPEL